MTGLQKYVGGGGGEECVSDMQDYVCLYTYWKINSNEKPEWVNWTNFVAGDENTATSIHVHLYLYNVEWVYQRNRQWR